jgi:uncharacterized protein
MRDERFEWDDDKAAANIVKHKVSFDLARLVFDDVLATEQPDDDCSEEDRSKTTGYAMGLLLVVVSTERNGRTRIISARRATPHERKEFEG